MLAKTPFFLFTGISSCLAIKKIKLAEMPFEKIQKSFTQGHK
jgi:hypothetical protein